MYTLRNTLLTVRCSRKRLSFHQEYSLYHNKQMRYARKCLWERTTCKLPKFIKLVYSKKYKHCVYHLSKYIRKQYGKSDDVY